MSSENDFLNPFPPVADGRLNALLGEEYFASDNYMDGYLKYAEASLLQFMNDKSSFDADVVVFPALYSMRHYVELCTKHITQRLHEAGVIQLKKVPLFGHMIEKLWETFLSHHVGDKTIRELRGAITPFVGTLAALDPDGQNFRYPVDNKGNATTKNQILFGVPHIYKFLIELKGLFEQLRRRVDEIVGEVKTGTYTPALSRLDLENISQVLPNLSEWGDVAAKQVFTKTCADYEITNNELLAGMEVIKSHRTFASNIGVEASLLHLTDEAALFVVQEHLDKYPPKPAPVEIEEAVMSADELMNIVLEEQDYSHIEKIVSEVSENELADISTLYYLFMADHYGEVYEKGYEIRLADYKAQGAFKCFEHTFSKVGLVDRLENTIRRIGRKSLADKIAQLKAERLGQLSNDA